MALCAALPSHWGRFHSSLFAIFSFLVLSFHPCPTGRAERGAARAVDLRPSSPVPNPRPACTPSDKVGVGDPTMKANQKFINDRAKVGVGTLKIGKSNV